MTEGNINIDFLFDEIEYNSFTTRIAPSPTGNIHLGNLYVFLWNLAIAKKNNGSVILRIDNTDEKRNNQENFIPKLIKLLEPFGFVFQTVLEQKKRQAIYIQVVEELIKENSVYFCNCSKKRLDDLKKKQVENNLPNIYDQYCFNKKVKHGVLRWKNFPVDTIDANRGQIPPQILNDIILLRSDNTPTYHLASCVDDFLLNISCIIRSEEWMPYASTHHALFQTLNQIFHQENKYQPKFIHLPLIKDLEGKLSKRKESNSLIYWLKKEYLPAAITNYLLSISWKGMRNEIFNISEVDINIRTTSPFFDIDKLDWYNKKYLKLLPTSFFLDYLKKIDIEDITYFNFPLYIEKIHTSLSSLVDIREIVQQLRIPISEILEKFRGEKILTKKNLKLLMKIFQEEEKEYISYADWKEKHQAIINVDLIHLTRMLTIGEIQGLNIELIINCFQRNQLLTRIKYCLDNLK